MALALVAAVIREAQARTFIAVIPAAATALAIVLGVSGNDDHEKEA